MAEFSINVGQSLVDKTLDQIKKYPYPVIQFPSEKLAEGTFEQQVEIDALLPNYHSDFEALGKQALELLKEEAELLTDMDAPQYGIHYQYIQNYDLNRHNELLSLEYDSLTSEDKDELSDLNNMVQVKETMELGVQISASYVLSHKESFTTEVVASAEKILNPDTLLSEEFLGFGRFFRSIGNAIGSIGRAVRNIGRWFGRNIRKIIDFKNPTINKLELQITEKPRITVGNPFIVENLKVKVATIQVVIPYSVFGGKWRTIVFTINNQVDLLSSGKYQLDTDALKVYVKPSFDKLQIRVKLLGVYFSFNLTSVANLILNAVGKVEVYDASNLVTPLQVKNFEYKITGIETLSSNQSLTLNIQIDVQSLEKSNVAILSGIASSETQLNSPVKE